MDIDNFIDKVTFLCSSVSSGNDDNHFSKMAPLPPTTTSWLEKVCSLRSVFVLWPGFVERISFSEEWTFFLQLFRKSRISQHLYHVYFIFIFENIPTLDIIFRWKGRAVSGFHFATQQFVFEQSKYSACNKCHWNSKWIGLNFCLKGRLMIPHRKWYFSFQVDLILFCLCWFW